MISRCGDCHRPICICHPPPRSLSDLSCANPSPGASLAERLYCAYNRGHASPGTTPWAELPERAATRQRWEAVAVEVLACVVSTFPPEPPRSDRHHLLPDAVVAELREPELTQALEAADRNEDPRPYARAGLQRRFRAYEGGDRPPSPPASLLRAIQIVERT